MADSKQPTGLTDVDGRLDHRVDLGGEPPPARITVATLGNVGPAMLVVVVTLIAVYAIPPLHFARPWKPGDPVPFWNLIGRPFASEEERDAEAKEREAAKRVRDLAQKADEKEPELSLKPTKEVIKIEDAGDRPLVYEPQEGDDEPAEQSLELFAGDELDRFFESLARSDAAIEGEITRVVHWGDSVIGVDGITSAIRRRMQARFGASGHGFHLMEPPNTSYRHQGVKFRTNENWRLCFIINKCRPDGHYGLGGTTFNSAGGAETSLAPHTKGGTGHVSRFELWYAAQPRGGNLQVKIDGELAEKIDTEADALEDRWARYDVEDGPHEISVRATGGGKVRVYGITLDRDVPGVTWDGLALTGAFTKRMLAFNTEHLGRQLDHREADLAVLMFGGNDMDWMTSDAKYEDEYRQVLQMVREARPEVDCLVISPLDHGERQGGRIVSRAVVPRMVEAQRSAAKAEGCAFFDTVAAMGGEGSAGRWYRQSPRLMSADLGHATHRGHGVVGEFVYRAILERYVAFRREHEVEQRKP